MISISAAFDTLERLRELKANLKYMEEIEPNTAVQIERLDFVTPLSIVPIAALVNSHNLHFDYDGPNSTYLKVIHFPEGLQEIEAVPTNKSYIPIIRLSLNKNSPSETSDNLNRLHSKFLNLLRTNVIADPQFIDLITNTTFGFLMGEMIDNIADHSMASNAYVFSQYWQKTNSCELCIVDDGVGVYGSLAKAGRDVSGSMDALSKILNTGLSAKTEFGSIKRGMGIKLTRAAITSREINGDFFIMSGDAGFLHSARNGQKFLTFNNYFWKGTVIMMKLNKPSSTFNLYNYVY